MFGLGLGLGFESEVVVAALLGLGPGLGSGLEVVVAAEALVVVDAGEERIEQPRHDRLLLRVVVVAHLVSTAIVSIDGHSKYVCGSSSGSSWSPTSASKSRRIVVETP